MNYSKQIDKLVTYATKKYTVVWGDLLGSYIITICACTWRGFKQKVGTYGKEGRVKNWQNCVDFPNEFP